MPKILRAHGPHGKHDQNWNWCVGEVVGVHGTVCCNSSSCGCDRAFIGVDSTKSANRAIVEEITESEFQDARNRLHARTVLDWRTDYADSVVATFDKLSQELLQEFAPGTVVKVTKTDEYVKVTAAPGVQQQESGT